MKNWRSVVEQISPFSWKIPAEYKPGMRVPGIIYADEALMEHIGQNQALEQVANVAMLPGIQKASFAMPDIHWGYGFPIGGVAATEAQNGVISAGGVGYDINCGVRLLRSNLTLKDIQKFRKELVQALFQQIPSGVGKGGKIRINRNEIDKVLMMGAAYTVEKGWGCESDLEYCEENGQIRDAEPDRVSDHAKERGKDQMGTLGSGNHFLEIQVVDCVYDQMIAEQFGVAEGMICVMIHSGSRGLGYQVCNDALREMERNMSRYQIHLPDRQLACVPIRSEPGQHYLGAMRASANFAWANRQYLTHLVRLIFEKQLGLSSEKLGMSLVYDVAHNIAKFERHSIDTQEMMLCVHRKGATRAFPANHPQLPARYQKTGQPVIIPGDMGRYSFLLCALEGSMSKCFGTSCHGAGRLLSRTGAKRDPRAKTLQAALQAKDIDVLVRGRETLAEEAPFAYKDVSDVVNVVEQAGISKKVCRLRPIGVIKG
ncbi:MAG: RtcB family protein [Chlamydiota bacterium]|nr:RtcB family protein [Chlamydiota bacterium]